MRYKIPGTKYSRDLKNRAVLCNDITEKTKYDQELQKHYDNMNRDAEINRMKQDIGEIKELLKAIMARGQNG